MCTLRAQENVTHDFLLQNSGLMQGKLLRRMKVPRDGKAGHYDWSDLNVGVDLKIFGRVYHIYDAEKATKVT